MVLVQPTPTPTRAPIVLPNLDVDNEVALEDTKRDTPSLSAETTEPPKSVVEPLLENATDSALIAGRSVKDEANRKACILK